MKNASAKACSRAQSGRVRLQRQFGRYVVAADPAQARPAAQPDHLQTAGRHRRRAGQTGACGMHLYNAPSRNARPCSPTASKQWKSATSAPRNVSDHGTGTLSNLTLARWQRLWAALARQRSDDVLFGRLLAAWNEPQRHYHATTSARMPEANWLQRTRRSSG